MIRAVARLKKLLEWFRPHWQSFDRMLVLKGPSWVEERGEARHYGLFRGRRTAETGGVSAAGDEGGERAVAEPGGKSSAKISDVRLLFDTLVIRAVARLRKLLEWFRPHWKSFDRMLVLKGPSWVEERGEARHYGLFHDLELRKLAAYPLPGTKSESVLLQIRRKVPRPLGEG